MDEVEVKESEVGQDTSSYNAALSPTANPPSNHGSAFVPGDGPITREQRLLLGILNLLRMGARRPISTNKATPVRHRKADAKRKRRLRIEKESRRKNRRTKGRTAVHRRK